MGKSKSKPKPPPPPAKPCEREGNTFCKTLANSKGCDNDGNDHFKCECAIGYQPAYKDKNSACLVIDRCLKENGGCDWHADCINRPGTIPKCTCKAPWWEDAGQFYEGKQCREVDLCGTNRGGCDEHASCIPRTGQDPLCKCHDGWQGATKPHEKCTDIDECLEMDHPPCGPPEKNAYCTNTPGSYTCHCKKGYQGSGFDGDCKQIQYCSDVKLNDCDVKFGTCTLEAGSYRCGCKGSLEWDKTSGLCTVGPGGDPNTYCQLLGIGCDGYHKCTPINGKQREYECVTKSKSEQLSTFLHDGPSPDTPGWVWGVVAISSLLLVLIVGYVAYRFYKRSKKKTEDEIMEEAMYSSVSPDYGTVVQAPQ